MSFCKIYSNGTLSRDFIAVKRDSDNVAGMYDYVSNTFFSSDTGTEFIAGPIKSSIIVPDPSTKSGSVSQQIGRLNEQIANAYNVCSQLGRTMPSVMNSANLADTIILHTGHKITYSCTGSTSSAGGFTINGNDYSSGSGVINDIADRTKLTLYFQGYLGHYCSLSITVDGVVVRSAYNSDARTTYDIYVENDYDIKVKKWFDSLYNTEYVEVICNSVQN